MALSKKPSTSLKDMNLTKIASKLDKFNGHSHGAKDGCNSDNDCSGSSCDEDMLAETINSTGLIPTGAAAFG
jgi:hypothetical protein